MKPEPILPPEVAQLGRAIRFAFVSFVVVLSYFTIRATLAVPNFEQIFRDMLNGKPLPPLTTFLFEHQAVFLIGSLLMPLVAIGTLFSRRLVTSFYLLGGLCALAFVLFLLMYHALSAPFFQIIQTMQGG